MVESVLVSLFLKPKATVVALLKFDNLAKHNLSKAQVRSTSLRRTGYTFTTRCWSIYKKFVDYFSAFHDLGFPWLITLKNQIYNYN